VSNSDAAALTFLATRIRDEIEQLDAVELRVRQAWSHVQDPSPAAGAHLDSVALQLHGFYTGIERMFELIARHIDGQRPGGDAWHRGLLQQISREVAGVRPAVVGESRVERLDDLRRFRHLVRHLYATQLDRERMYPLVEALPTLWQEVRADLLAFSAFLDDLAKRS
jgi:hypothetical protein